jgi:hypothetical protein
LCVCAGFFFEPDFNACLKLFFVPLYAATLALIHEDL